MTFACTRVMLLLTRFAIGIARNIVQEVAQLLDKIKMPIRDRIVFVNAPIQTRDEMLLPKAIQMAKSVGSNMPTSIDDLILLPELSTARERKLNLKVLESTHRAIMLYLWLR